ncbi:MAG TPA: hypothetical protein DCR40_03770 [Prolixibacteraceae bacterium]|nr:hypothetical protein [Prolixibacteraceae bacterium]
MKKKFTLVIFTLLTICTLRVKAQEEKKSSFSVGADLFSNYIWRGTKFGTGPAFQPSVKFNSGILTIGVWGSFDAAGYTEVDPYFSFAFSNGFSFGMTDYYYPSLGGSFTADSANAYEVNAGFTKGGLSLSANYILNKAALPASSGNDMYFQAGYAFTGFNISLGAGDGWHTSDSEFNVCHVGIGTGKTIKISDSFSIPVTGQVIVNPEKNLLYLVVGITL